MMFLQKYWWVIALVYFLGHLLTYSIIILSGCILVFMMEKGNKKMVKNNLHLIDPIIRQKNQLRCHFCGSGLSVKYMVDIFDPVVSDKPTRVTCCNKCAVIFGGGKEK